RHYRVAGREGRDVVAAIRELANELEHDALGPAVALGRDALDRRRDLPDAKWLDQYRTSESRTTATPPEAEPRPRGLAGSVAGADGRAGGRATPRAERLTAVLVIGRANVTLVEPVSIAVEIRHALAVQRPVPIVGGVGLIRAGRVERTVRLGGVVVRHDISSF